MRKLSPLLFVLVLVLVFALFDRGSRIAQLGRVAAFDNSGTNGASCKVAVREPGVRTRAYCVVLRHRGYVVTGVSLGPLGNLRVCHDAQCTTNFLPHGPVSMGPLPGAPVGKHVHVGPFRCTVLHAGVRCITVKTRTGFLLSTRGAPRVLHLGASH